MPGLAGWWPGKGTGLGLQSFSQESVGYWEGYMSAPHGIWHLPGSQQILVPFHFLNGGDKYEASKQEVSCYYHRVVH